MVVMSIKNFPFLLERNTFLTFEKISGSFIEIHTSLEVKSQEIG